MRTKLQESFGKDDSIRFPGRKIPDKKAMLARTKDALARGVEVICEAAFCNYNNYCAVDILKKENGAPRAELSGAALKVFESEGGKNISLSISHDHGAAIAFCCIEWKDEGQK